METLVIKNNLLSGGSEKLYRDAIVSKGSLFCFDFSNKGCVSNGDLTTVRDLALESKNDLGIIDDVSFDVTDRGVVPDLTNNMGYPIVNLGSYNNSSYDSGLNIHNVDDYLFTKQPPRTLFVAWMAIDGLFSPGYSGIWFKSGDASMSNIRLVNGASFLSVRMVSEGFTNHPASQNVVQMAVERQGVGLPNKLYINGKFYGVATELGGAFSAPDGLQPISIGLKQPNQNTNVTIYRTFLEDLTVSGRTAQEVIAKDYAYVNAINEYAGIEKRPFANL